MSILTQFRYISTETGTAYIDSRVYCAEIIEIEHGPWMTNVILKYQAVIESRFSLLHFKNGAVKTEGGRGLKYTKYVLMTEPQCNFALALSRNSPKVIEKKADLIAEFEAAKKVQKSLLERQLAASLNPTPPREIAPQPDNTKYNITSWKVHADSGIVDPWYVRKVIV